MLEFSPIIENMVPDFIDTPESLPDQIKQPKVVVNPNIEVPSQSNETEPDEPQDPDNHNHQEPDEPVQQQSNNENTETKPFGFVWKWPTIIYNKDTPKTHFNETKNIYHSPPTIISNHRPHKQSGPDNTIIYIMLGLIAAIFIGLLINKKK